MDPSVQRIELIETVLRLPAEQLSAAADFLQSLQVRAATAPSLPDAAEVTVKEWPHAPRHRLSEQGAYMVTTGTYQKAHLFGTADRLTFLENSLLATARQHGWQLEAWAVFSNHYHFVGYTLSKPCPLRDPEGYTVVLASPDGSAGAVR